MRLVVWVVAYFQMFNAGGQGFHASQVTTDLRTGAWVRITGCHPSVVCYMTDQICHGTLSVVVTAG